MNRNARLGLLLFSIYLVFYAGFVLINAYAASWMELTPVAGVNLAIWYGFGLIFGALFLAIIYGVLCSRIPQHASPLSHRDHPSSDESES